MPMRRRQLILTTCAALGALFASELTAATEDLGPHDWLNRMVDAVQTTDYEGTVIRLQNGVVDALKVVHVVSDGVVHEKVIVQEGNGLEIIRNGNEVHCIFPDRESVLVEEWNDQSTLFSTLPSSDIQFGSEYDVSIVGFERVAGRKAVSLAVRPHDDYRYGHRIWLDAETGFPLQSQLIGNDGAELQQVKFADIHIDSDIQAGSLAPSYSTEGWKWFTQPRRDVKREVESGWVSDEVPAGYRVVSTRNETLSGSDNTVTHILYSDGLANVSVFIAPGQTNKKAKRSSVGASNSYSTIAGEFRITAVGEVPWVTVEQIATAMRPRQ